MAVRQIVRALAGAMLLVAAAGAQKAEAQNWDGSGLVRFGVFLQASMLDYDINRVSPAGVGLRQTASPNGGGVGISAGYDLRLGSFVIGAEADASFDDGGAKTQPFTNEKYGIDFFATGRGRLGYYFTPGFMVYGTAGYAALGAEYKLNGVVVTTTTTNKKYGTLGGFVYGGGMEYDLGWGIGFMEYLHTDTSSWDFLSLSGNTTKLDASQDVFRLGMKFKVGHDYAHDVYKVPERYEPLK